MPSGPRQRQRETPPPVFFFDRGVGRVLVPSEFSAAGYDVKIMADVYPDRADQRITDDEWIARASTEGWIAITKDAAIICHHEAALRASNLVVFCLPNANLTGEQMAERFRAHLNRIIQRARQPGPTVWVVQADRLERRRPPGRAPEVREGP